MDGLGKGVGVQAIEGCFHQIRCMFVTVGNHVETLHRESMGGLRLDEGMTPGAWRVLGAEEVRRVW